MRNTVFLEKRELEGEDLRKGIIDIHAHILPGVDDGARDMGEALEIPVSIDLYGTPYHTGSGEAWQGPDSQGAEGDS